MADGDIKLRLPKISDGSSLNAGLRNMEILETSGLNHPAFESRLSAWWWLRKTYDLLYSIEVGATCIGFIGLYNLKRDRSTEMTLVIFDRKNRRTGYGTRVFNLLARVLERKFLKILVRVRADNNASISFWSKLGFKGLADHNGIRIMSLDIQNDCNGHES
jgi:RimJ/RimL family protein N-acetyltransferase